MAEWRHTTVGELCDAGFLKLQTGPFGSQLHAHDYVKAGVSVVPTEAIQNRRIKNGSLPQITSEKAKELSRHRLLSGDILFARRGVQATGKVAYVRPDEDGFFCGTGAIRLRVRDDEAISSEFLSHVFADPTAIAWFKFHAIGATMPNLNEGIIRSFPLRLPPLPEQRTIAGLLSALDDKIDLNHCMNETLEAMARAIFKNWFVDFGPVRAKIEGSDPVGLAPEIAALFPHRLGEDGLPEGWRKERLDALMNVSIGRTPPRQEREHFKDSGGGCTWLSIADMAGTQAFAFRSNEDLTFDAVERFKVTLIPAETVVVSFKLTVGRVAITAKIMCSNEAIAHLVSRPDTPIATPFVYCFMKQFDYGSLGSTSSIATAVNSKSIKSIPITVPNHSVHEVFEQTAHPLFRKIKANGEETLSLVSLRDFLLPRLMSGELRVKDAEKLVEQAA